MFISGPKTIACLQLIAPMNATNITVAPISESTTAVLRSHLARSASFK